ncbi:DNA polymerase III subunit alpha [Microbulbifer halophilus]|uniref:DNA polymerase III subunit alpha n=1 Tax=Microbulbifer halophilus TaxID=453963 RepID=A0ABW5EGR0_9GAMM|nr:DNA polymerase III subunit alpha [Microbulbifer halophilus]MCW8127998.1 DNA polymerase III subunit alpha [Microbulbifer halophilus]
MTQPFVHLRVHSEFSLIDGLVRVKPLVARAEELEMPALALTDQANFYGQIKFYKACLGAGIKPITAADFWLSEGGEDKPTLVTLYAMNGDGYRNITELISRGWMEGQYHGQAYIRREWLSQYAEGVLMLSGARHGDVGRALIAGRRQQARELAAAWARVFPGRYYLELQRTGRPGDEDYLHEAVALAQELDLPVVATNDVRFLEESEFEAHEVRVCIHDGRTLDDPRRERNYSPEQYFRTPDEMAELFSDIPEALQNTVEIARRCTSPIQLGKYFLPEYPIPDGMTEDQFFEKVSFEGMERRLEKILDKSAPDYAERRAVYETRLRFELDIILQMGFPGYFLIVMDFIQWAKDHDIPVGPGRGSGAGSLVAYSLDITDLDPMQYDLLFERFLNPERVSMPDFDVDFCMEKRDQVIGYVADYYGRDAVSQIITFGTMAAKAVVRDVARVQGKSYGLADKLSKMIPPDPGMTLEKALEQEEVLREFLESDEEGQEIWEMAVQLEGVARNVGKHAGGVVIAPTKLTDFSPLYCDETGAGLVTQFDKNDVEDAGLVKFDFLGLRTLTIIDWAKDMVDEQRAHEGKEPLDIAALPLDDKETFTMLKKAETTAVFQLESRGMKELIKRLKPDNLEDMIALVALFRPGPLQSGMVDDFINRKHGHAQVAYPDAKYQHEKLKPILEPTYGVIIYQEQVMQIAQELAGYTLGGADLLRRAMGKKKPEEMAKQREIFAKGSKEQGVDPDLAMKIFDLVEKFAGYGFNKSHSAAYALVSYQTAWLKAHYPAQFMAATMSSDMDKTDKVVIFIEECRAMGLELVPPDVNLGSYQFSVPVSENGDNRIIYGLGAIKGLGEGPIENIIAVREEGGPFTDLFDFCSRIDPRKVNKRALEALVRSGALDSIGPDAGGADGLDYSRAVLFNALDEAVKGAEQQAKNASAGMMDLFGEVVPQASDGDVYAEFRRARPWGIRERLEGEKNTLGLYLTGHPIDEYEDELQHLVKARLADLKPGKESQKVAGLVVAMRVMKTKRGDSMAIVTLDDRSARIEAAVFSEAFGEHREKLAKDALLVLDGPISHDDYSGGLKMTVNRVATLDDLRRGSVNGVRLQIDTASATAGLGKRLAACLQPYAGGPASNCGVLVEVLRSDARGTYRLPAAWKVEPNDQMVQSLRELLGRERVTLNYTQRN